MDKFNDTNSGTYALSESIIQKLSDQIIHSARQKDNENKVILTCANCTVRNLYT